MRYVVESREQIKEYHERNNRGQATRKIAETFLAVEFHLLLRERALVARVLLLEFFNLRLKTLGYYLVFAHFYALVQIERQQQKF